MLIGYLRRWTKLKIGRNLKRSRGWYAYLLGPNKPEVEEVKIEMREPNNCTFVFDLLPMEFKNFHLKWIQIEDDGEFIDLKVSSVDLIAMPVSDNSIVYEGETITFGVTSDDTYGYYYESGIVFYDYLGERYFVGTDRRIVVGDVIQADLIDGRVQLMTRCTRPSS